MARFFTPALVALLLIVPLVPTSVAAEDKKADEKFPSDDEIKKILIGDWSDGLSEYSFNKNGTFTGLAAGGIKTEGKWKVIFGCVKIEFTGIDIKFVDVIEISAITSDAIKGRGKEGTVILERKK